MTGRETTVIKVGGSILRDEAAYHTAARRVAARLPRGPTWVVVSAAYGVTDALERLGLEEAPDGLRSLVRAQERLAGVVVARTRKTALVAGVQAARRGSWGRLLAWGEQESVVAFQVHLARQGIRLPIVELELGAPPAWRPAALVPGFYLRGPHAEVCLLPRGGSDISAVLVAAALGARTVRLWKDGGGIRSGSGVVAEIDTDRLLARLSGTIRPLHPTAVRLAAERGIDLILEDPLGASPSTRVVAPRPSPPEGAPAPGLTPVLAVPTAGNLRGVTARAAAYGGG